MKKSRKFRKWLEIVLVMALILSVPLVVASCATKPTPVASATAVPSQPPTQASTEIPMITPTVALPTAAPMIANGQEPPPCTFPLAQITTTESTPENYTFSKPKIVLTAKTGNLYTIAQWLPDNQQVLMTEVQYSAVEKIGSGPAEEFIDLFNPSAIQSKVYALRTVDDTPPAWNPALNAVVYPATHYTIYDYAHATYALTHQVWISYGDPNTAQKLADNLSQFPLTMKPDGSEIVYLSGNQLAGLDESLKSIPSVFFDPTQWDYAKPRGNSVPEHYAIAWQPGTSLIFLYSDGISDAWRGYTFILNSDTGKVCELKLGGWALKAHWSSDGHYLAFIRSINHKFPTYSADLTVLDTVTGNLKVLSVIPQKTEGLPLVHDFVWAPDNRHLLAVGNTFPALNSQGDLKGLYLVDFVSGQSVNILPQYNNFFSNGLAWSPDGSKLVIRSPINGTDRVSFISVQKTGQ